MPALVAFVSDLAAKHSSRVGDTLVVYDKTDPQAGQSVYLGKRAHQHQVVPRAGLDQRRQFQRVIQEFNVRLVHDQNHVLGNLIHKRDDLLARGQRARGVVRVGHKHKLRFRRDGPQHGGQVVAVIFRGHGDQVRAKQLGDDGVNGEAILRDHHVRAGAEQGVAEEFYDFVGTVAQHEAGGVNPELGRQFVLQVIGVAIGVKA